MPVIFLTVIAVVIGTCAPSLAFNTPPVNLEGRVQLTRNAKQRVQLLPMKLETALTPQTAVNDPVEARLILPVDFESVIVPVDSRLKGKVTAHKPGERFGRRTQLGIQWTHWCADGHACQPIPDNQPQSVLPAKVTGTSGSAFKRFLPLQLLSFGISVPLGLTAMPLWSTLFIEQGVGAAIGATYESIRPEEDNESRAKRLVKGALNSTSLPTITRFVKKAPDITIAAQTAVWMPVDASLLNWMAQNSRHSHSSAVK